jgi:hypothetical protein
MGTSFGSAQGTSNPVKGGIYAGNAVNFWVTSKSRGKNQATPIGEKPGVYVHRDTQEHCEQMSSSTMAA